jgi:dephospho-CoA kinase
LYTPSSPIYLLLLTITLSVNPSFAGTQGLGGWYLKTTAGYIRKVRYNKGVKLFGISGTNGSGKDTLGLLLAERHGYCFMSVTEPLREECRKRGWDVTRENLRTVSAEWRREGGLGVLVDKAVELYNAGNQNYKGLVIASLRNPGEAVRVHELDGTVIWVDADPRIRYERIHDSHRGRDEEDNKTYEEFLAEEQAEMHSSDGDAAGLNMEAVREESDVTLINEDDIDALDVHVVAQLAL